MKTGIHPNYHADAEIKCACGAKYNVGSINESTSIELCSACHPFYTGKQKIIDTARRVEKFENRFAAKTDDKLDHKAKLAKKAERAQKRADKKEQEAGL